MLNKFQFPTTPARIPSASPSRTSWRMVVSDAKAAETPPATAVNAMLKSG